MPVKACMHVCMNVSVCVSLCMNACTCAWCICMHVLVCACACMFAFCTHTNTYILTQGHTATVQEVDFHPNEPIIGSCSSDKKIYLGEIKAF